MSAAIRSTRSKKPTSPKSRRPMTSATARHKVLHDYHDHSFDPFKDTGGFCLGVNKGHRGGVTIPFPAKLHVMLSRVDEEGMSDVVSWQPHGRCFVVHKPHEFVNKIMQQYFKQSKLTSFQRQLNLYGFARITKGADRGGYYHELFLRHKLYLCQGMSRIRIKGTGVKGRASPESEPDFYSMPWVTEDQSTALNHDLEEEVAAAMIEEHGQSVKCPVRNKTRRVTPRPNTVSDESNGESDDSASEAFIPKPSRMESESPLITPDSAATKPVVSVSNDMVTDYCVGDNSRLSRRSSYSRQIIDETSASPHHSWGSTGPEHPKTGDEISFLGQRFHYMDSFTIPAPPIVTQPSPVVHQPPSQSLQGLAESIALARTLREPILTPSTSSSSLCSIYQKDETVALNPDTIFGHDARF